MQPPNYTGRRAPFITDNGAPIPLLTENGQPWADVPEVSRYSVWKWDPEKGCPQVKASGNELEPLLREHGVSPDRILQTGLAEKCGIKTT